MRPVVWRSTGHKSSNEGCWICTSNPISVHQASWRAHLFEMSLFCPSGLRDGHSSLSHQGNVQYAHKPCMSRREPSLLARLATRRRPTFLLYYLSTVSTDSRLSSTRPKLIWQCGGHQMTRFEKSLLDLCYQVCAVGGSVTFIYVLSSHWVFK
jgi:hypothetical protein